MIGMRLKPDARLSNHNVDEFAAALHDFYKTPAERTHRTGRFKVEMEPVAATVLEWHLGHKTAEPWLWVQRQHQESVEQYINTTWPRVTIEREEPDPMGVYTSEGTPWDGADMVLKEHYMYAIRVDRRSHDPLPALLEITRMLREDERALVQIILTPAPKDWADGAHTAYEKLREGRKPKRISLTGKAAVETVARGTATVLLHTMALVAEVITGEEIEPEPIDKPTKLTAERRLRPYTAQKGQYAAFDTDIRVLVFSREKGRRTAILRALTNAWKGLDADNSFEARKVTENKKARWMDAVINRRTPSVKINKDYLSVPEAATLLQLATGALQQEYGLANVQHQEFDLPVALLSGGIKLGQHTFRGEAQDVFMPVDDWDLLCLPRIVIGGMGTGKTCGFGGNWGAQALGMGFSVFTLDVAKDELGDEVAHGAKLLGVPDEKIVRLKFGQKAYRLDWCEAEKGGRAANRLAGEVVNFFNLHGAEVGIETSQYLRMAAKTIGYTGGTLYDMMRLFIDEGYRLETVERLENEQLRKQWDAYEELSSGMKGKVTAPVLNRLDLLLGDEYLAECLQEGEAINFCDWISGGYHVAIHLPKQELGAEAVDILADFIMGKIELAMLARPEEEQTPAFVICDEPHQFASCAPRWARMAVETRKWRLGLVWMFHAWEQIPHTLAEIIKASGPHYHVYTSSPATYRNLAYEIAPFVPEEAIKTPRHFAINVIRLAEPCTPFVAAMNAPPSHWRKR
jgi:hypothetical protein